MVEQVNQKKSCRFLDFLEQKILPVSALLLDAALLDAERMSPKTEEPFLKSDKHFFIPVLQYLEADE